MVENSQLFADQISLVGRTTGGKVDVVLTNELVGLLSEQMYRSPLKAVEELVVNAYDADASECRVFVPAQDDDRKFVVVFDDGAGMNEDGLQDLWAIGRSKKRDDDYQTRLNRKQIGKFGIGKLATYTIAKRVTYISKSENEILGVTIDYTQFQSASPGKSNELELPVHRLDADELANVGIIKSAISALGIDAILATLTSTKSWTLVLMEDFKEKAKRLQIGRLRRVLSTAMPLKSDFKLYVNGGQVESSKAEADFVSEWDVTDLPSNRLDTVNQTTEDNWRVIDGTIISDSFPQGVSGRVLVTVPTLTGKSDDLARSNGFFIRVRGRLVSEDDEKFGLRNLAFQTLYRFRADLDVDDLDADITAPRDWIGDSELKEKLNPLLYELFNEARTQYRVYLENISTPEPRPREHDKSYVPERLVEFPIADVLIHEPANGKGSEPDEDWFYLDMEPDTELNELAIGLYSNQRETKYSYSYSNIGKNGRLVRFSPTESKFVINNQHDLVMAYSDDPTAQDLLEDMVTAEAMLEVYLRGSGVDPYVIGEVLERRDSLLRGLANDRSFSFSVISESLIDAMANDYELEVAQVAAMRSLGFVAKHIGGSDEPDGLARLTDYPDGETLITLEAKSSIATPTLSQLDFAGLRDHMDERNAKGCLLIAPAYPGLSLGDGSAAARRAATQGVSCWTVRQLADVVEAIETRHISAKDILEIVLAENTPDDVDRAVTNLLEDPPWEQQQLYRAVLVALRRLEGHLLDASRNIDQIATVITTALEGFEDVDRKQIEKAVRDLAGASQGALRFSDGKLSILTSLDELGRRVASQTGNSGQPRRGGSFRLESDSGR